MNDDRLLLEMRRWLQGEEVLLPDAEEAGEQVAARLPTTKQQRRRRSWFGFRARAPKPPTTSDTIEYRPGSIPASNGHTPTVIGRTQSMLSPAKAITAGALIFAVGGAFLISQPLQQPAASAPGAEAAEITEPVEFTAVFTPSSSVRSGTYEVVDDVVQQRGNAWSPRMSGMSDPRLDGTLIYSEDSDRYPGLHEFASVTYRIVNDDGAWEGSTPVFKQNGNYEAISVVVLVGEGAYDGMHAWMDTSDWGAISGVIFPAAPPAAPVPPELP